MNVELSGSFHRALSGLCFATDDSTRYKVLEFPWRAANAFAADVGASSHCLQSDYRLKPYV